MNNYIVTPKDNASSHDTVVCASCVSKLRAMQPGFDAKMSVKPADKDATFCEVCP